MHSLFCLLLLAPAAPSADVEFFEKHVRPVLVEKCISCHGPKAQRGGLRLDSRQAVLKGGDSGPALIPGQPEKSPLVRAIRRTGDLKMPPKDRDALDANTVNVLARWVQLGAPWPAEKGPAAIVSSIAAARKSHWAFRPVVRPTVPTVKNAAWAVNPVDHFILARLDAKGLAPSPRADRRTLIRRLSFDLLGLPPTPDEVEAFVTDQRPDAYEQLVDRLLASPAYGERWGRHWLDVARYADTKGYVFQEERRYPYSFTYRDYVVSALNEDLPYDRFILHQLAADKVVSPSPGKPGEDRRALAAMGFLTLGRRFLNNANDIIDDRIDVVTRGLMGLTVTCARCHDHKFDPIPTRDYYSLHGVFASSVEPGELPLLSSPDPTAPPSTFQVELRKRQAKVQEYAEQQRAALTSLFRSKFGDFLLAGLDEGRSGDLNKLLVTRWRTYLTQQARTHHPVLAPWFAFARLKQAEFAGKAQALAAGIAANRDKGKPINPLVARAFAGKSPASLAEVAGLYDELSRDVERAWQEAQKTGKVRLEDANLEAVRQILHGPGSPTALPLTELDRALNRAQRNRLRDLRKQVDQWQATAAGGPPRAMALVDRPTPVNPHVLVRGNPRNPGVAVQRQFLEVLSPDRKPFTQGSGRLELAQAITSKDNPLTSRVMVNRVWMHHFGRGLVPTSGNFGIRGEPPTHPELLDWLADTFSGPSPQPLSPEGRGAGVRGWSVKRLHRLIVLSATYRQSSDDREEALTIDPDNSLLWRMNRRRLEFEPLRNALLAVAGTLDRHIGGPAVNITEGPYPPRRSIYGFIDRQNLPGLFRTFDLASPDASTPERHATTVPQQSLFLMNSPFVQDLARGLAARVEVVGEKEEARIQRGYRLAYGRPADPDEVQAGLAFVRSAQMGGSGALSKWEQYAQVLLLANEFAFVD